MSLISVDSEKCARDGICVDLCPIRLLVMDPENGPKAVPGTEHLCIGCGHCVAACPHGALDSTRSPLAEHTPIPSGFSVDPDTAAVLLRSRRSIRQYKEEPVSRDMLIKLLDVARFAPSGHNSQGISFLIVEGRENLLSIREIVIEWMREVSRLQPEMGRRLNMPGLIRAHENGEDRILRGAPQLIVAHARRDLPPAMTSSTLALEYAELYATTLGLGTCWAGYTQVCAQQSPALSEFLKIPADRGITGILMIGYPKYGYYRLPPRNRLDVAWFGENGGK